MNFARKTNSRIRKSRENYISNNATKEKGKLVNSKLRQKPQIISLRKLKHPKITKSTVSPIVTALAKNT